MNAVSSSGVHFEEPLIVGRGGIVYLGGLHE